MPIILEHQQNPTSQDWQDLEVIIKENQETFTEHKKTLQAKLKQTSWLVTGRFNQRIVGYLLAQQISDKRIELSQAYVRKSTQRRGVMHQMIELLSQWADTQQQELSFKQVPKNLQSALSKRQFTATSDCWLRTNK